MSKLLLFGEPLIRITPLEYAELGDGVLSQTFFGGSEVNIACNLQALGVDTCLLTALPSSKVGDRFLHFLSQHLIDTTSVYRVGDRIGTYYLESGYGCRQSEVFYDRKHTSISELTADMLDMDALFKGITHFHFSGITVAIGPSVRQLLLTLVQEAKRRNIRISMDLNLRTKMINVTDAKKVFSTFAMYADDCFGIDPLMIDDQDTSMFPRESANSEDVRQRMLQLKQVYSFQTIFHTLRSTDEYGRNGYQAYALGECFEESLILKTPVLQRVGSGDAFISGALHQLIKQASLKEVLDFGVASATLKCTVAGDSMIKSEADIRSLLAGKQDIVR
ncbi:sugar kinase [Streptococcus sp. ZJ93]|uniref:sugar kinase n=1 Tax=Streptococcus handemini TaxID=3161188 RepID=UPI0034D4E0AF